MSVNEEVSTQSSDILVSTGTERSADGTRRCFICLTDEDATDAPGTWVDPCPCTLEAHQDCMLSWVTDCERTNKPLKCPVCKSGIELEAPRDIIVSLNDALFSRFTNASPYLLFTGMSMGVQFSLQMYGALALWSFAGKETMMRFLLGPRMVIDGNSVGGLSFVRQRILNAALLMNVAPALLFSQLLPNLSNKVFVPTASLYGMFQLMHDDGFFSWPPSPQLAMTVFPHVRFVYYSLWREFILPYEIKLNRQIMGLPAVDPNLTPQQNADRGRQAQRNAEGGFVGLLQGVLDALDPDDEDDGRPEGDGLDEDHAGDGQDAELMFELRIEEINAGEDVEGEERGARDFGLHIDIEAGEVVDRPANGDDDEEVQAQNPAAEGAQQPAGLGNGENAANDQAAAQHEAPQAPPVRRLGVGGLLSSVSNAVVSALVLPGVSFAIGEALRLSLPKAWTASSPRNQWTLNAGSGSRPGLLQQQWGRSLVGGCLYVVLKDMVRVYAKSRRVAVMKNRRVKNVERKRREDR